MKKRKQKAEYIRKNKIEFSYNTKKSKNELFAELANSYNLTNKELAKKLNISIRTFYRYKEKIQKGIEINYDTKKLNKLVKSKKIRKTNFLRFDDLGTVQNRIEQDFYSKFSNIKTSITIQIIITFKLNIAEQGNYIYNKSKIFTGTIDQLSEFIDNFINDESETKFELYELKTFEILKVRYYTIVKNQSNVKSLKTNNRKKNRKNKR